MPSDFPNFTMFTWIFTRRRLQPAGHQQGHRGGRRALGGVLTRPRVETRPSPRARRPPRFQGAGRKVAREASNQNQIKIKPNPPNINSNQNQIKVKPKPKPKSSQIQIKINKIKPKIKPQAKPGGPRRSYERLRAPTSAY